jgi:hypothetical protein
VNSRIATGTTPRARIASRSVYPSETTRFGSAGIVVLPNLWGTVTGNAAPDDGMGAPEPLPRRMR